MTGTLVVGNYVDGCSYCVCVWKECNQSETKVMVCLGAISANTHTAFNLLKKKIDKTKSSVNDGMSGHTHTHTYIKCNMCNLFHKVHRYCTDCRQKCWGVILGRVHRYFNSKQ